MKGAVVLLAVAACGGNKTAPKPAGGQIGPALIAAMGAADEAKAPWRCGAQDGPTLADEAIEVGGRAWTLAGHAMTTDGAGPISIGVVADAGGAAPSTVAALGRLRDKLAGARLVLALGGMGTTQAELEATLGALAEGAAYPVVAVPGDLEAAPALTAAIAALRGRGVVVDGRLAQRIELDGATIAVVAGALAASRLAAGDDGCEVAAQDVRAALAELGERPGVRIVASAEAPRALVGGEAIGDVALTADAGTADVALYGTAGQPASRARSGRRGGEPAALTPGSADATPRLTGPARPSAGLLVIDGGAWTWKPLADTP